MHRALPHHLLLHRCILQARSNLLLSLLRKVAMPLLPFNPLNLEVAARVAPLHLLRQSRAPVVVHILALDNVAVPHPCASACVMTR